MFQVRLLASLLIVLFASDAYAGDVRGPREASGVIVRGTAIEFTNSFVFQAENLGEIIVHGSSDTDLDCWMFNAHGTLVDYDTRESSVCILKVYPIRTGSFTVRVANVGNHSTIYALVSN